MASKVQVQHFRQITPDFTPGPYSVEGFDPEDKPATDIYAGDELIASCYPLIRRDGAPEANARLFAASLDLYKALEAAVKFDRMASANLDTLIEYPLGPSPWMEKALAALAKARGGK